MMGHRICFKGEIWLIIPKLSLSGALHIGELPIYKVVSVIILKWFFVLHQ